MQARPEPANDAPSDPPVVAFATVCDASAAAERETDLLVLKNDARRMVLGVLMGIPDVMKKFRVLLVELKLFSLLVVCEQNLNIE